jgi:hypothetical protein
MKISYLATGKEGKSSRESKSSSSYLSICGPCKLLCSAVPRSSSGSVVGSGRRPSSVEEALGPSALQDHPFNHPVSDLRQACKGREWLLVVW